jgi:predicted ester cyclase
MENLVIEKGIAFFSQEYSDAMQIETLKINVTPTDVENIKKAMDFVKNNSFVASVNVDLNGFAEYLNDDNNEVEEWRVDVERFVVYSDSVYYYAQNKWHSGDQIESEAIDCDDLGIVLV